MAGKRSSRPHHKQRSKSKHGTGPMKKSTAESTSEVPASGGLEEGPGHSDLLKRRSFGTAHSAAIIFSERDSYVSGEPLSVHGVMVQVCEACFLYVVSSWLYWSLSRARLRSGMILLLLQRKQKQQKGCVIRERSEVRKPNTSSRENE